MKKLFVALTTVLSLAALLYLPAGADHEGNVEIFVTPKVIAISVDMTQLDYGSAETGTTDNRPIPVGFNVTNAGTAPVRLQIAGDDTVGETSGDPGWELNNLPGADAYVHRYAVNLANPTYPGEFAILDETAGDFLASLAVGLSVNLKFSLDMPTTTSVVERQTAPITVIALEAP